MRTPIVTLLALILTNLILTTTIVLAAPLAAAPDGATSRDAELLRRFAPVIVQGCHGRADYMTRFDYDGNWNGQDNWDNLDRAAQLPAVVYTAAIATTTHWYLTYSVFHPRDWWPVTSIPYVNHENDLEGVLVVLEKNPAGEPELVSVETISHNNIKRYSNLPAFAAEKLDGKIQREGEHPIVEAEGYKHGIHAWTGRNLADMKGSVIYRFKAQAQTPRHDSDPDCGYDFVSLKDTFWAHREEVGPGKFYGEKVTYPNGTFGARINGDNYGRNKASAPWNWSDGSDKGLAAGDWFFNPARTMQVHYPRNAARFSLQYTSNEFVHEGFTAREIARTQLFAQLDCAE